MIRRNALTLFGVTAIVAVAGSLAFAQTAASQKKESHPTAAAPQDMGDMPLPPGWTEEDMMACMAAATPGEMQARLAEDAGVWKGTTKMWMGPGTEPMASECTTTVTPVFDGRYIKVETEGDMPGMGPFHGFGIYGYDNVSEKFQGSWIDNCGTGVMYGVGDLSSDGDTLTFTYAYTCPITKKPTTMRQVDTRTGPNAKKSEMYATDPKSGKEYKMMEIAYSRSSTPAAHSMVSPGMISNKTAELGCGFCSYKIDGVKSCSLAAKIDGKTYQVTGSDVNCHQFCGAKGPKPAIVSGKIVDGKFVATSVELKEGSS